MEKHERTALAAERVRAAVEPRNTGVGYVDDGDRGFGPTASYPEPRMRDRPSPMLMGTHGRPGAGGMR